MGAIGMRFARSALAALALALLGVPAAAQTPVKFTLDWKIEGPQAPFVLAADRDYYKAEGLDVTIDAAGGSLEPITRVASGAYDIGFGDINALIKYRDQNPTAAVKPIFIVYNKPAYSVVGRKSRGITKPTDLEGKRLGGPTADSAYAQWPLFARLTGIDASKVIVENVGIPVREPMLAAGQVDAITGFSFSAYVNLIDRGVPADDITLMLMADYGLKLYGNAIIVNTKFATEKPEAVKAFLRAYLKGLRDTIRDPAHAVESVIRRDETLKKSVELERLHMAIRDNIITPEVTANGYGGVDMERLAEAIDQLETTYRFKTKPTPSDVFDPSFLPPAADRKIN